MPSVAPSRSHVLPSDAVPEHVAGARQLSRTVTSSWVTVATLRDTIVATRASSSAQAFCERWRPGAASVAERGYGSTVEVLACCWLNSCYNHFVSPRPSVAQVIAAASPCHGRRRALWKAPMAGNSSMRAIDGMSSYMSPNRNKLHLA